MKHNASGPFNLFSHTWEKKPQLFILHSFYSVSMETSSLRKAIIMEIILISAQELTSMSNSSSTPVQTYVVAYINPKEKVVSRVDRTGNTNPTWNDKFVFSVDEEFEHRRPNCCLLLEIYNVRRCRNISCLKTCWRNCTAFLVQNPLVSLMELSIPVQQSGMACFMKKCQGRILPKLQWNIESWWAVARSLEKFHYPGFKNCLPILI